MSETTTTWREKLPAKAQSACIHGDDEGVDRIEIVTVPCFKTSGMSGDEWRVSAMVRLYRKGVVVAERSWGRMQHAAAFLPGYLLSAPEESKTALWGMDPEVCFQPGCSEPAVSTYLLKKRFCVGGGNCGQEREQYRPAYRRFCERHLQRGDCDLEDADDNYEVIDGPGPNDRLVNPLDQSPSVFGGVVRLDGLPPA